MCQLLPSDTIIIGHILIEVDPDSTYLGEVKIGFLSSVDGDNGDFNQIIDLDLRKKSDLVIEDLSFVGGFHCLVYQCYRYINEICTI